MKLPLVAASLLLVAAGVAAAAPPPGWPGEEMPLPLSVRTPQDLALKGVAERQYLIFNLIAGGKVAWDRGDYATATQKWEALLRLSGLDPEIDRAVRPLATDARTRAGNKAPPAPAPAPVAAAPVRPSVDIPLPETRPPPGRVTLSGTVSGGGSLGPGGAVVWLKRADGNTPRPSPSRGRVMNQSNKTFVPRILPVTVGTKVDFRNTDAIFHNVFSLSRPNDFDAGLYKGGEGYTRTFNAPGPVQILCNIHASMIGYVVVVDTPWYAQADASGAFAFRGIPSGDYVLEAWHEGSTDVSRTKVTVGPEGLRGFAVRIGGDRRSPTFVPDKYGKPRQAQLGY